MGQLKTNIMLGAYSKQHKPDIEVQLFEWAEQEAKTNSKLLIGINALLVMDYINQFFEDMNINYTDRSIELCNEHGLQIHQAREIAWKETIEQIPVAIIDYSPDVNYEYIYSFPN